MKDESLGVIYYMGSFSQFHPNGEGHMKWTESPQMEVMEGAMEYKGTFKNGVPHGVGKMLLYSGRVKNGTFEWGIPKVDPRAEALRAF